MLDQHGNMFICLLLDVRGHRQGDETLQINAFLTFGKFGGCRAWGEKTKLMRDLKSLFLESY